MDERQYTRQPAPALIAILVAVSALALAITLTGVLRDRPTQATGVPTVDPGGAHTCAITAAGEAKCWGWNHYGQVGDGTIESPFVPSAIGLTTIRSIATGANHTCALLINGTVRCWGLNDQGQLGEDGPEMRLTPGPAFFQEVRTIAAGANHTCIVRGSLAIVIECWGDDSDSQLGDLDSEPQPLPTVVCITSPCIPPNTTSLAAGSNHTCALDTSDGIRCWGSNEFGQLGDGDVCGEICAQPAEVCLPVSGGGCLPPGEIAGMTAGGAHTCAVTVSHDAYCWGRNEEGQLGNGTEDDSPLPVRVCTESDPSCPPGSALEATFAIAAGLNHTCALSTQGDVSCWGINSVSQLGNGSGRSSPLPIIVPGLPNDVISIAAGSSHTCTVAASGAMHCWGWNADGRLGDGTFAGRDEPVAVVGFGPKDPNATATQTATPPPATPTTTPAPPTATNTPAPPTPSHALPLIGDANCDSSVTAVDAALTLQLVASLLPTLQCSGVVVVDVDASGVVNSIDVALILQFVAGLLPQLPP